MTPYLADDHPQVPLHAPQSWRGVRVDLPRLTPKATAESRLAWFGCVGGVSAIAGMVSYISIFAF
ncbi:MAG: hypothetical protein IPK75_20125 [Acidobacteria bacterium]|nr:hypothetical protein [Acidobacteriota bacterium]